MHYRHPRIGFAFDLPEEWELDSTRMSAEDVTVILKLGETRLLLQVRRSHGNAAARLSFMQDHLAGLRATRIAPCQPPPFGKARDIVALSFFIAGRQQRWISVSQDGYDYTLSHTDDWQDVAAAVDRVCGSFVFPPPGQAGLALGRAGDAAPAAAHSSVPGSRYSPVAGSGRPSLPASPHPSFPGSGQAAQNASTHASRPLSTPAALWQRVSERLRRGRVARTQG